MPRSSALPASAASAVARRTRAMLCESQGGPAMTDVDHAAALRRLLNGFQVSQAIHVAASLGIADLLSSGPCDTDALAAATDTDPGSLYRLLRALAAFGLFTESDGRTFALTEMGQLLRSDVGESLAGWASFIGRPYYWNAWTYLGDSVRTGRNAFRTLHGVSAWEYRASHPEESAIFDRGMTSLTQLVTAAVVATYDFGRFRQIADIGGGSGTLLAAVLAAAPSARGVL